MPASQNDIIIIQSIKTVVIELWYEGSWGFQALPLWMHRK